MSVRSSVCLSVFFSVPFSDCAAFNSDMPACPFQTHSIGGSMVHYASSIQLNASSGGHITLPCDTCLDCIFESDNVEKLGWHYDDVKTIKGKKSGNHALV